MAVPAVRYTLTELAAELGVSRRTVSDLVRVKRVPLLPAPSGGRAKWLGEDAAETIRQCLRPVSAAAS